MSAIHLAWAIEFPIVEAAGKLISAAIRKTEKIGRAVLKWLAARKQLAILFAGPFDA